MNELLSAEPSIVDLSRSVRTGLRSVMALPDEVIELVLVALLARGHVLVEGVPGTGKTLLVKTLSRIAGLDFKRIQFTNDLMPSDIVGSSMWRPDSGEFVFVRGPLFANVVLADEINRTSPRTLSCLLEAMESGNVSIDGKSERLAEPFFVLATRNPIEFHGTFPMPEAALDRFLVRVTTSYPEPAAELELYLGRDPESLLEEVEPALRREELLSMMHRVETVRVQRPVAQFCQSVVHATRNHADVVLGVSTRAALSWLKAARARAALKGRDYVLPDDLKVLVRPVLAHRMVLRSGTDPGELLADLIARVDVAL